MLQYDFIDDHGENVEVWSVNVTHHERICYLVLRTANINYLVIYSTFTSTHGSRQFDYVPDRRRWRDWRAKHNV